MIFTKNKSVTDQIKEILELCEEQEVKTLIKYKRDGYTFVISNDNKAIDAKTLDNNTSITTRRRKKGEDLWY